MWRAIKDFYTTTRSLCSYANFESAGKAYKRRAYVVFVPYGVVGTKYWIHACLHKEFSHCFVFWFTKNGIIKADSLANVADISYMKKEYTVERYVNLLKRNKCKILRCDITPHAAANEYLPLKLNPNNCVSLTKSVLGIAPRRVLTPFQLYTALYKQSVVNEI